jgi:hypothetical protein
VFCLTAFKASLKRGEQKAKARSKGACTPPVATRTHTHTHIQAHTAVTQFPPLADPPRATALAMQQHKSPSRRLAPSNAEKRDGGGGAAAAADASGKDLYDERHRQTKALAQYERQKLAWERMQAHLLSATATSPASLRTKGYHQSSSSGSSAFARTTGSAAPNMTRATAVARARREDNTIVHVATAAFHNGNGSHAWEGLLRCTNEQEARRLVPIGRTAVPYPLYSEMHDPSALPDDHLSFARVVSAEDVAVLAPKGPQITGEKFLRDRTMAQEHVRAALTRTSADAKGNSNNSKGNTKASTMRDLFVEDTAAVAVYEDAESGLSPTSYYEEQLQRFAPYVQQRLGHLLQPRTFLHVEGHPAPYATAEEATYLREAAAADGDEGGSSAPPVEFFPPTPPPQTQLWASSAISSRPSSRNGVVAAASFRSAATSGRCANQRPGETGAASTLNGDDGDEVEGGSGCGVPRGSAATAEPHYTDGSSAADGDHDNNNNTQSSPPPSPLHPMRVLQKCASAKTGYGATSFVRQDGPSMELSTRSLFFSTRPGEMLHGSATLRNTGSTTVYYSWTVVDAMHEHLRECYEAEQRPDERGSESSRLAEDHNANDNHSDERSSSATVTASEQSRKRGAPLADTAATTALPYALLSLTHQLATHQRTARESFFFMSAPMNGVVLPGEEIIFPFSVRATREGLFQSTYELLTVPPAPKRIFVRLRALVQRAGPSLEWLARPVAEALAAKVVLDAQRQLVQSMGANPRAIVEAELREQINALDGAADAAKHADWVRRRKQEEAWHRANRMTFDHIPFQPAVYDKLEQLSSVVQETLALLRKDVDGQKDTVAEPQQSVSAATPGALEAPQKQRTEPFSQVASFAAIASSPVPPGPPVPDAQMQQQSASLVVEAPCPATMQWDGALSSLLYQIMCIRDNATRQVFLEALQVLLRAARASRDVVDAAAGSSNSRSGGSVKHVHEQSGTTIITHTKEVEDLAKGGREGASGGDDGDVPLTVLLTRAAAALADVVVSRQHFIMEKQSEDALMQPVKPAAALSLTSGLFSETSGGAAAGPGKGRAAAPAPSNAAAGKVGKKSGAAVGGGGNGRSVAESKEVKNLVADGSGGTVTSLTPAQLLLSSSLPSAALEGFSVAMVTAETMTLLRAAEERVVCARVDGELDAAKKAFTELLSRLFREAVDAACDRTPLATCTAMRLAELRAVQQSTPLVVDASVDPLVAPPSGKPGKRK